MSARKAPRPAREQRSFWRRSTGIGVAALLAVAITASASGLTLYRIKPGDTLSAIAARYHTSVAELIRLNNLPGNGNMIIAGHTLRIPTGSHGSSRTSLHRVVSIYVVRPGDSLYAISARQHVSWHRIARVNHLPSSLMVVIGQRLRIPHWVRSAPAHHYGSASTGTSRANAVFGNRWVPSRDAMAATIRATAQRWGVDPRLALGISFEESGFNQRNVSVVGAIGAMQVMPSTGVFVGQAIVHRHLDLLNGADNATAGVALLAVLLRETHGDERLAAAGYYQGLASVRSRGMYADTKQYVANVLALRNRF
jgi:LysM repeat protein